jgi:hypothetical protein
VVQHVGLQQPNANNNWIFIQDRGTIQHRFSEQNLKVHVMSARRFSIKRRRRNTRGSTLPTISGKQLILLLKAIETERDNLSRADSLLGCLIVAMEYGETMHKGPYYPDVAQIAHAMVRKSISALDPIHLPRPSRDEVKEEYFAKDCAPLVAALHEVPLLPRPIFTTFPRQRLQRLHHRNYSRSSSRNASNMDSASANTSG